MRVTPPSKAAAAKCPDQPLHELAAYVLSQSGLDPNQYRPGPLRRRLAACQRALRVQTPEDALETLGQRPDLLPVALSSLLIGVSEFFRDTAIYAYLWGVLSEAVQARCNGFRVWSAGCANGAELYSVAIFLDEMGLLEGSYLLGTDCRSTAIQDAKSRLYSDQALSQVNELTLNRYFRKEGALRRLVLPHAARIHWAVRDALAGSGEDQWDIILCRNVAIYLKPNVCQRLWADFYSQLRPGGMLIVGKAERPTVEGLTLLRRSIYWKSRP